MLDALSAAHRIGMVHRDVKPENVLIGDDGSVKVADFGLARVTDGGGATATRGVLMGTVAYVPPELVTNGSADPRSDVYAAGIVLYEMLTGTVPFRGESALNIAWQHVNADVPPPSDTIGGLPEALDDLTLHATRREPGARPTDAGVFLAELRDVRADLALPLVPPPARPAEPRKVQPTTAIPRGELLGSTHGTPAAVAEGHRQPGFPRGSAAVPPPTPLAPDSGDETVAAFHAGPPVRTRRPIRRGPLVLAIVLALGLLAGGAGWYFGVGQYTQAPSVLGKTRADAVHILAGKGLTARDGAPAYSETVPKGSVAGQSPAPNGRVLRNGTVVLFLSQGPERHAVPKVVGSKRAAAERAIRAATLRPLVRLAYDDKVDKGVVVSATPAAGAQVRRDTVVTLVVSKGPPPVTLPDVTGKSIGEVRATLRRLGLKVSVDEQFDKQTPEGTVMSQRPGPGTVLKGSTVTLVVSKGPPLVQVPDVRGKSFGEAQGILTGLGFNVAQGFDIPGGDNSVLSQTPGPGTSAPWGSTVTLYTF
jgi:serine/threonine-protein kinase